MCLSIFLSFSSNIVAQNLIPPPSGWSNISSNRGSFNFHMPVASATFQKDTLGVLFYHNEIDTILGLQTHYIDGVSTVTTDSVWQVLLAQNNSDTLRAFAGLCIIFTNGQLSSIQDLNPTALNPKGVEFSITMPEQESVSEVMFTRIYYHNGRFFAFTANGVQSDINRLNNYKNNLFNSISIY